MPWSTRFHLFWGRFGGECNFEVSFEACIRACMHASVRVLRAFGHFVDSKMGPRWPKMAPREPKMDQDSYGFQGPSRGRFLTPFGYYFESIQEQFWSRF